MSSVKCVYCDLLIDTTTCRGVFWNVDHVFPKYLHNLVGVPKELLDRECNKAVVHCRCNKLKGDLVPDKGFIISHSFNRETREELFNLYDELLPYLDKVKNITAGIYEKQDHRCAYCHNTIPVKELHLMLEQGKPRKRRRKRLLVCKPCIHKNKMFF